MLFLLPPSETKAPGGKAITIHQAAQTFGALNPARLEVLQKLGDKSLDTAPTMPAIQRYTGTLYSAIHGRGLKGTPTEHNQLTADELKLAKQHVLIQSALFGLIAATDLIPVYKLAPNKLLNGLNLKTHWNAAHAPVWPRLAKGPVIDLRSKAYAELAPLPTTLEAFEVTVYVQREDGSREQLNHFNKKAKGQLVRAALTANKFPETIAQLKAAAKKAGLVLEQEGRSLILITTSAT
ncbi:peroxide stress protein YaaA [Rhodoluna sp.]|uniref:YaaA family protein n=1 Tax=Rhodoluna sp. TaxID=1969481 RepID=UPI0025CCF817|nr:peroxide stress protein YaaA [Rhodoluna sp.]